MAVISANCGTVYYSDLHRCPCLLFQYTTVLIVFHQVLSRGTVVAAGSITGSTFSFLTTPEMAPSARIVVYYVRADGEIVTDSVGFSVDGVFLNEV